MLSEDQDLGGMIMFLPVPGWKAYAARCPARCLGMTPDSAMAGL